MSISLANSEEEIRQYFRKLRDRLNKVSAKLDVFSGVGRREDIKAIFTVQSGIYEWFMSIYEDLEKLFLEMHKLSIDFQKYEPIMKHFKNYLTKVEQERERFK